MATIGKVISIEEGFKHTWPYNLVYAIYGEVCDKAFRIYIPGLLDCLNDDSAYMALTDRERKILDRRFHMGLTLKETGNEFGVNAERIRQIEARALRKLRHPSFYRRWHMVQQEEVWEAKGEASALALENATMRHKLIEIAKILGRDYIPEVPEPEPEEKPDLDIPLDELELSVRSYNCCKRAGYDKVRNFVGKTTHDLLMIRNLGRKSMEEVIAKLKEHGVEIKDV